jgi:uncharacterized protein YjiK
MISFPSIPRSVGNPPRYATLFALLVVLSVPASVLAWISPFQTTEPALARYDLSPDAGVEVKLHRALQEVSGLAVSLDGRLFAHHDERAILYQIDPETGGILKAFSAGFMGVPGDFEGIAIAGDRFFLITSDGQLVEFREGEDGSSVEYQVHVTGLGARCEMEGLAFDPAEGVLLLPCKTARDRVLEDYIVVFVVPLDTLEPAVLPRIFCPLEELKAMDVDDKFHPSAIEVHPETGSILLVAAREEALLEFSPQGRLLAAKELKRKSHPQPEGLAFLPDGTLVLADEGQGERGRLTRYPRLRVGEGGGS